MVFKMQKSNTRTRFNWLLDRVPLPIVVKKEMKFESPKNDKKLIEQLSRYTAAQEGGSILGTPIELVGLHIALRVLRAHCRMYVKSYRFFFTNPLFCCLANEHGVLRYDGRLPVLCGVAFPSYAAELSFMTINIMIFLRFDVLSP